MAKTDNSQTDLTGRTINGWNVLRLHSSGLTKWWLCKHSCGHEKALRRGHMERGGTSVCPVCSGKMVQKEAVPADTAKPKRKPRGKSKNGTSVEQLQRLREKTMEILGEELVTKERRTPVKMNVDQWELGRIAAYSYAGRSYRPG